MQFGLFAPSPATSVGSREIADATARARSALPDGEVDCQITLGLDVLAAADRAGFDLALYAERHLGEDIGAWVIASAIAPRLARMRALVAVHPGLLHPVMVAKLAASLDRICPGRAAINIVNGWFEEEFRMFGGAMLSGEPRYRRAIEFIEILRGLWQGESLTYAGEHYLIDNARLLLKPATREPPPIYAVTRTEAGRGFIARSCDWWFVEYPKEARSTDDVLRSVEASIRDMDRRTAALGRKVRYGLNPFLALGTSPEAALEDTLARIAEFDPNPDTRKIESRMLPATKAGLIGRPADVRRQIRRYADMGLELLLLKIVPTAGNMELIGAEVIEPLRARAAVVGSE